MTEEDIVDPTYSFDEDGDSEGGNYHYSNNHSHGKRRKSAPPSSTLSLAEQQRAIEIQEQEAIRRHQKNTLRISIIAVLVVVGILILSILLTRENNDGNDDKKTLSPSPTDIPALASITVQPSSSPSTSETAPETILFDTPSQEECLAIAEGNGSLNHNIEENSTLLTYVFLLELDMHFPINTTIVTSELQQDLLTNLQTTAAPIIAGCPSNNEDDDPIIIRRRRLHPKNRILVDALTQIVNVVFQDMQIKNPTPADQQCTEEIDEAACIPIVVNVLVSVVWSGDDESEATEHLSVDVDARFLEAVEAINDDSTGQEIKFVNLQWTGIVATPPLDEDVPTMSPTTKLDGEDYDYEEFDSIDIEYETFVYVTEDVVTANNKCSLGVATEKVETCPPTISIEQTACEAPLVVYGRVLEINKDEISSDYGAVKIQVNYKSKFFSGNTNKFIPKYGAGINNQENGTAFYDDSSFFTTWIHGFLPPNTTVTDPSAECGTLVPSRIQEELEDAGTTGVDIDPNTQELTVNMTLASTKFRSGTAPASSWDYVDEGILNDEIKLAGDCQAVYCCYNPDCADCEGVLEKHERYECPEWTEATGSSSAVTTTTYSPSDTIQTSPPSQSISGSCGGVATPCESLTSISDCMYNPDTALDTCDDFMNICRPLCDDQATYCECQQNDIGCEPFGVSSQQICHASIDCVGSIPSCTTLSTEEDCLSAIGCEWSVPIPTAEPTDRPTPFPTTEPSSPSPTLPTTSNPATPT